MIKAIKTARKKISSLSHHSEPKIAKKYQRDILSELDMRLDKEIKIIKEERDRHSLLSYRGQELSKRIPGILIARRQILDMLKEI